MLLGLLAAILVMVPFRAFMYNSDSLCMFLLLSLFQNVKTWFCLRIIILALYFLLICQNLTKSHDF